MSEIVSTTFFNLHEGRLDDFRRLFAACAEVVRREDTGTTGYEAYLSEDRSEAVIVERYVDEAAVQEHVAHIGPDLMGQVMATGSTRQEVFGPSTETLVLLARQASAKLFTTF